MKIVQVRYLVVIFVSVALSFATVRADEVCTLKTGDYARFSKFLEKGAASVGWMSILEQFKVNEKYDLVANSLNVQNASGQCLYVVNVINTQDLSKDFQAVIQADAVEKKLYLLHLKFSGNSSGSIFGTSMNNGKALFIE